MASCYGTTYIDYSWRTYIIQSYYIRYRIDVSMRDTWL